MKTNQCGAIFLQQLVKNDTMVFYTRSSRQKSKTDEIQNWVVKSRVICRVLKNSGEYKRNKSDGVALDESVAEHHWKRPLQSRIDWMNIHRASKNRKELT